MKSIFVLLLLVCTQLYSQDDLFHQNKDVYADFDFTKEEILEFKSQGKLSVFNEEKHKTNLANRLFNLADGGSISLNSSQKKKLKVLKSVDVEHYRINYMFFDGNKVSYEVLDNLRNQIIELSKSQKFEDLAERYSMDKNRFRGGDSGWFKSRSVPMDFKNAIISNMRAINEIFKVDLEDKTWYYLILKIYSPKVIKEILVLETQE